MHKLLRVFFIAALIVGSPSNLIFALAGTEYYVDISAAAGGDGSLALPWTTISDAVDSGQLTDGDTVHIATGIYDTENFPVNLVPGVSYIGAGVSTEIQPPSSLVGNSAAIFQLEPQPGISNTTLSNLRLNSEFGGLSVTRFQSATTSLVVNQVTYNGGGQGDLVYFFTYDVLGNITISNCDVTDGNLLGLNMQMLSASLTGTQVIDVKDNSITNAPFDAIDIDGISDMNCDISISDNVSDGIGDNGLTIELHNSPIANVTITNNTWNAVVDEAVSAEITGFETLALNVNNNTVTDYDIGFRFALSNSSFGTAEAIVNIDDNHFGIPGDPTGAGEVALQLYTAFTDGDVANAQSSINGNTVSGLGFIGIGVQHAFSSVGSGRVEAVINNNTITERAVGMDIALSVFSNTTIDYDVKVHDNTITSNYWAGIIFSNQSSSSASSVVNHSVDLGTVVEPGNNSIHSNGANHPDYSSSASSTTTLGDIFLQSGSPRLAAVEIPAYGNDWNSTDLAAIEDNLYHRVDDPELMLILFDAGAPLPPGAPIAVYDTRTPADCAPLVIDVADNDLDVNGDIDLESVVITQNPGHGTVVVLGGGLVEYTADYTWVGADTFNYHISDLTGLVSNIATVQVDSPGNNELPEANYDAFSMSEADGPQTYDIAANDTVPSGRPLDLTTVDITQNPAKGTVVNNLDGTVTYTYTGDLSGALSTTDTFNYTIRDDCGVLSNVATVEIEITRIEDTPGVTDNNVFKLFVEPLSAGQAANVNFVGATANSTIKIYASRIHQFSNTTFGIGELGNPRVNLGATQSNMFGSGSVSFTVPAALQGQTIWFQALDHSERALSSATSADVN